MARLLQRLARTSRCLGQRPSRDEFQGINQDSIQAQNLMAWWPMWEPVGSSFSMDYGPYGLHMVPSANTSRVPDPMMGMCWYGTRVAQTSPGSGQAKLRRYKTPSAVDPVDFGNLPSTGAVTTGVSHMASAWFKVEPGLVGTQLQSTDVPKDMYIYAFDRNDGVDYPGHALTVIMRQPNDGTSVATDLCVSMFDNAVNNDPYGVQHIQIVNDGQWHLVTAVYVPPFAGNSQNSAQQWIYLDGDQGFIGGLDNAGVGAQPFGYSRAQTCLGSAQDAAHAGTNVNGGTLWPAGAAYQVVGADDDGVSSPFLGLIADHRLYAFPTPPSVAGSTVDLVDVWRQMAKAMYHPDTRWELYQAAPSRRSYFLPVSTPLTPDTFPSWLLSRTFYQEEFEEILY